MKYYLAFVFSIGLLIARSEAQVAITRATPVLTPQTPAISVSTPFAAGTTVLAPVPATSPSVNNIAASMAALSTALVVLQTNVLDTLPLLAFFNDNYEFGDNFAPAYVPPPGNLSVNMATNYAVNFGVNTAVSTGGSLFNAPVVKTPVVPGGVRTVPGFASLPVSRDTLRALVILQNDMERLLPLLDTLNGGAANSTGLFTNAFGFVLANP
jgi:hypothetical protein